MSENQYKVAQIATDMFKHVVANNSDDPCAIERVAGRLGRMEFGNYLMSCPCEFLADRDFLVELWHEQDPVKFLLSRKTLDADALVDLACTVGHFLTHEAVHLEECATTYLESVFTRAWRFNPAEVGYLWRLLHDQEFPIMPATHSLEHDVIANVASMGAAPEEVLAMAHCVHDVLEVE